MTAALVSSDGFASPTRFEVVHLRAQFIAPDTLLSFPDIVSSLTGSVVRFERLALYVLVRKR